MDTCPECGARAVLLGALLTCQGPLDVSDDDALESERALKRAVSAGTETDTLDKSHRLLLTQKTCGKQWNPDGSMIRKLAEGTADTTIQAPHKHGWR